MCKEASVNFAASQWNTKHAATYYVYYHVHLFVVAMLAIVRSILVHII